jgi:hypothetical protein
MLPSSGGGCVYCWYLLNYQQDIQAVFLADVCVFYPTSDYHFSLASFFLFFLPWRWWLPKKEGAAAS